MSDRAGAAGAVLLSIDALVIVAACASALRARNAYARLHYSTLVSALGGPLLLGAVLLGEGVDTTSALVALIVIVVAVTNPAATAAIAKLNKESRPARKDRSR